MTERIITVSNRAGLHLRPAGVVVKAIKDYNSNIYLEKGSSRINAKSIMGIVTLNAAYGTELRIIAEGEDEEAAVETIAGLFASNFEEE
jgi:phosphocarrier protein